MDNYSKKVDIRWSDLDPNFHLRHSAYYDFGAYCRIAFLTESGITPSLMQEQHIGPILFREECVFRKEIKFGDDISINLKLDKCTSNFSRWTMKHEIWKSGEILCAIITIDGAWLDTQLRKLTVPGALIAATFDNGPKTDGFILQDAKSK